MPGIFDRGGRRKPFAAAGRKRSIRRRTAKNGLGLAAEQGPILSDATTLGVNGGYDSKARWRGRRPTSHLVPLRQRSLLLGRRHARC
jgi:hypothetical protein